MVAPNGAAGSTFIQVGKAMFASTATAPTAAPLASTTQQGMYRITTGSATSQNAVLGFCGYGATAGTPTATMSFAAGNSWTFEALVTVSAGITANSQWLRLGLVDGSQNTTTQAAQGAYIELTGTASPLTATAVLKNSSSNVSVTSTVTTAAAHRYTISYNGSSTFSYSIDGNSMGTAYGTTNSPAGVSLCPGIFVVGTATTPTSRTIDVDYISYQQVNSAR